MYTLKEPQLQKSMMKQKIILFIIFLFAVTLGNGLFCRFNLTHSDVIVSNILDKIDLICNTPRDLVFVRAAKDAAFDICFILLSTVVFSVFGYSLLVYTVFFARCFVFGFCGGALVLISVYTMGSVRLFTALFILYNIVIAAAMLCYCSHLITSKERKPLFALVMIFGECGIIYISKLALCILMKSIM